MANLHVETIRCREIPRQFGGKVNVTCNTNSSIVLWNKYHVIIYDKPNDIFITEPFIISSEFTIENVLMHENYLLCLDCSSNININTITSYNNDELSSTFRIRKENITACELINDKYVIALKIDDKATELSINEFNSDFRLTRLFRFPNPRLDWQAPPGKHFLVTKQIRLELLNSLARITFNVNENDQNYFLVVICLDKTNVYACIVSDKCNTILKVVKIFKSHSEIVGINICTKDEIYVLVGQSAGNIIKVPLNTSTFEPKLMHHLQTALHKYLIFSNAIIHTDGLKMWKSEDIYSNIELTYDQFIMRNVRDFCIVNNKIICTTFSNLIYSVNIFSKECYVKSFDSVITKKTYVDQIKAELKKNVTLIEPINQESQYLFALSLAKRPDIMDSLIQVTLNVFDTYSDLAQFEEIMLTEEKNSYYDTEIYYFVSKISVTTIQHKLNKLLSDMLGDIKIHITLLAGKALKTTSIKINEQLRKKCFVIPLKRSKIIDLGSVQVIVKIITNIPARMNEKQRQWIILYNKCININAENFIKTDGIQNGICLKEDNVPLETIIWKQANHLHGTRYKIDMLDAHRPPWTFYLKLPHNYLHILSNEMYYSDLDTKKRDVLLKCGTLEKIQKSTNKTWLEFDAHNERVILSLEKDVNLMNVSCRNINIALDIRNLFSRIFFSAVKENEAEPHSVNQNLCDNIKTLHQELQRIIYENQMQNEKLMHEIFNFLNAFYITIFRSIPI